MSHPDDLGEVRWVVVLEVPADLPEGADVDEFLHHLATAASDRFGATGKQAAGSDQPFPHHALRLTGSASRSQLWPARSEQGLLLFVAGPEPLPEELAVWQDALAVAKERLSGPGTEFRWAAILGPDPDDLFAGAPTFEAFSIGSMSFRPASHPLCEWRETTSSLTARRSSKTWPVIVEGTSAGYVWHAASRKAAADLRRLAALLSVASGHPWLSRQDPAIAEPGKVDLSEEIPKPQGFEPPEIGVDCPKIIVPQWLTGALAKLDAEDDLCNALLMHHEGVLVAREHPSLAVVAHVAALDGIGKRYAKGNKNRVKAALAQVLSEQEADDLIERYELRCSTVHEGMLHGDEIVGGMFIMPAFYSPDPAFEFIWRTLRQLSQAARALIVKLLEQAP